MSDHKPTCLTPFRVDKYEVYDKDEADAVLDALEVENTELRKQNEILSTARRLEEKVRQQAEAERDKQVWMLDTFMHNRRYKEIRAGYADIFELVKQDLADDYEHRNDPEGSET